MTQNKTKKKSLRKKILLSILILVVVGAGIYWYVATEKFSDTKDRKAAYTLSVTDFLTEFKTDFKAANAKYTEKIVALHGRVSEVEPADTTLNIKFIDSLTNSYVIFSFQSQHITEAKTVKPGDSISIKGACSGGVYYELIEQYGVNFKRSTLDK